MAIRSSWAYINGKRILKSLEIVEERTGFLERKIGLLYAEKSKSTGRMSVKTYSNMTQAEAKAEKLRNQGHNVRISGKWPYTIIKICS